MSEKFQIGDIVEAFGCSGVVVEVRNGEKFCIQVNFDIGVCKSFLSNGAAQEWHKTPSLKLIERPIKKVKKKVWIGVGLKEIMHGGLGIYPCSYLSCEKENLISGGYINGVQEIEIEVAE